jgi:hypothetical protein
MADAVRKLEDHGIRAVVYPSPRHTLTTPRWRVIAPVSRCITTQQRAAMVARINGALGGILASESFTASQIFYFGRIRGAEYSPYVTFDDPDEGSCIDTIDSLDQIAIGKAARLASGETVRLATVTRDTFEQAVEKSGQKLKEGDGRRAMLMQYLSRMSIRGRSVEEMMDDVNDIARLYFDGPIDEDNIRGIAEHFRQKDARAMEDVGESYIAEIRSHVFTLAEMMGEFVMLEDGAQVTMINRPYVTLPFNTFKILTAASFDEVDVDGKGKTKKVLRIDQWNKDPNRMIVYSRTNAPGQPAICKNPEGQDCVNIWTPIRHVMPENWQQRARPFVDHVRYLVPNDDERERFLNWLAHAEQKPGVRPHTHYLMRTRETQGVGRNWMAEVLFRVWRGQVAPSVDLMGMLAGGFNGLIAGKIMAVVDELHVEQAGTSLRKLAQALKGELTALVRNVKPKYGREYSEFCCTRWLMFSNHVAALPISETDRRLIIIENPSIVKPADYFTRLYGMLDDQGFIDSVRQFLRDRDIRGFNPGEHAPMTEAKQETIEATTSEYNLTAKEIVSTWESDVILSRDLQTLIFGGEFGKNISTLMASVCRDVGMVRYPKRIKFGGKNEYVWILRAFEAWKQAGQLAVAEDVRQGRYSYNADVKDFDSIEQRLTDW